MLTKSNQFQTNITAPSFNLLDVVSEKKISLDDAKGSVGTVIMFICNHCPFVIHINKKLVELASEYQKKGINFIAISSNDAIAYPQDGPTEMKKMAQQTGYVFPYLYDETQQVAKDYKAACTPDFYIFDSELQSFYHGQLCDSRPGNGKIVTGEDIKKSLDALVNGTKILEPQKPSIGCNIKWK